MRRPPSGKSATRVKHLLPRLVVSCLFAVVALWGVGVGRVASEIAHAEAGWLLAATALTALSFALGAVRWRLLLGGAQVRVSTAEALNYTWIGLFFANVLPSGFGGDAVRAYMLGRDRGDIPTVTASVLVDRLTAVWALLSVGLVAALLERDSLPASVVTTVAFASAGVAVVSVLLLASGPTALVVRLLSRWPRITAPLERMGGTMGVYRTRRPLLLRATALSVVVQGLIIVGSWCLMQALGVTVSLTLLAPVIPVALLSTAVPVSLNGFGVRETVFRALLVPAGVPASDAVAFSIAGVTIAAIISLPGAALWAVGRRSDTGAERSSQVLTTPAGGDGAPLPS